MKLLRNVFYFILILLVAFLLYVGISLGYSTLTDFQPEEEIRLTPYNAIKKKMISDSSFSFITWNLGYAGLGAKSDFFFKSDRLLFSGDAMVRSPEALVEEYLTLQSSFFEEYSADFYLLQEVDLDSKRSYHKNQYTRILDNFPGYESTFAVNYDVKRVPIPILEPHNVMGKVYSGLATFSRFPNQSATRFQLPGEYEWSTRIFQLDRCIALHRYPLETGKELVVMNVHNSAFDKGGFIKKQQVEYFKNLALEEYEKGNYVIAGGDWNQCPPDFPYDTFAPELAEGYIQYNIKDDLFPQDWQWVYDPTVPTNRKTDFIYEKGASFITLIDFYLISPNVEVKEVKGIDLDFAASDHQPVYMEVRLK
jgi:endonuclease/exonuclease/phosphatase family metal-dependent hydrolase